MSPIDTKNVPDILDRIVDDEFPEHPFDTDVPAEQLTELLGEYHAMSRAFPYLQAGSQGPLIFQAIEQNTGIREPVELTSVVGNFLTWDETGGHHVLGKGGIEVLPEILKTAKYFHANLLDDDLKRLFGHPVPACFTERTRAYLYELYRQLADLDDVRRTAAMVAFELHAGRMIEALWRTLGRVMKVDKDELVYFRAHVGGDDPAEPYHVAMTQEMISRIVPAEKLDVFLDAFRRSYALSHDWCATITNAAEVAHVS